MCSMLTATVFFADRRALRSRRLHTARKRAGRRFVLTLVGFALLTLGGWLGGSIVFVHGMRVLNLVDEPPDRAAAPVAHPEKGDGRGRA